MSKKKGQFTVSPFGKSRVARVPLIWWDEFQKWLKDKKENTP